MTGLLHRLRLLALCETGSATVGFVLAVPVVFTIFLASVESGMMMMRLIMLQRATDIAMRDLRLGHFPAPTPDILKREICSHGVILGACNDGILIELQPIRSDSWAVPAGNTPCVDRPQHLAPPPFVLGSSKEIMLVRVCLLMDPLFPTTGLGLNLDRNGAGYALTAASAFVNEPDENR